MKSIQEVFNTVGVHLLLAQNAKSLDEFGSCKYRFGRLRCALGCLIPDERYVPEMEGGVVSEGYDGGSSIITRRLFVEILGFEDGEEMDDTGMTGALNWLQKIHDRTKVEEWRGELLKFADHYKLEIPEILK